VGGSFERLPAELREELIRLCPGQRLWVPKRPRIPDGEIIALVVLEMQETGRTRWDACCRVGRRTRIHPRTVCRIVTRRYRAPRMDPEYGGR
jgi:hypothetical protein